MSGLCLGDHEGGFCWACEEMSTFARAYWSACDTAFASASSLPLSSYIINSVEYTSIAQVKNSLVSPEIEFFLTLSIENKSTVNSVRTLEQGLLIFIL